MTFRFFLLVLALSTVLIAGDRPAPDAPVPIAVGKIQQLETAASPVAIPIHCSPDGDLLLRTRTGWSDGLVYIEASSGKTYTLQLNDPQLKNGGLLDFLPVGNGRVNALFAAQEKPSSPFRVLLTAWDADGTLARARTIEPGIHPWHFVTFPSTGNVLLAGTTFGDPHKDLMGRPALLLLDSNGRSLRSIDLQDGYKPPEISQASADGKLTEDQRASIRGFENAMAFSVLYLDESGNAIFRRGDSTSPAYFISPAGEVVRKIKPPKPVQDGILMEFRPARGRLLWRYIVTPPGQRAEDRSITTSSVYFVEMDAETGETIRTYVASDPKLLGPFGCYTPGALSFVSSENGRMELVTADLR